jgi:hypothetical protein
MVLLITEPERKNRILKQFAENKDENFLMDECFKWTLEPQIFQDIGVLSYPVPPKEWLEYENLSEVQRLKMDNEFFHQFAIKEYLQKKSWVYSQNYAHWQWLKQIDMFYPRDSEHQVLHQMVDEKLDEFVIWFSNSSSQLNKLKNMFNAQEG